MVPKADISRAFLIENMVLSISYWANCCESEPKLVWGSANGVESNHIL